MHHLASLKKGFVKLLKSRPNVVNYIRKLAYNGKCNDHDHLLSPILSNFLLSISRLNCLAIKALDHSWDTLDSSLTSAFLHLMRLPTINHIDLSHIRNFPLSSLTLSVNLLRLDISYMTRSQNFDRHGEDGFIKNVQSETMPKIRELNISNFYQLSISWILDDSRSNGIPTSACRALRGIGSDGGT